MPPAPLGILMLDTRFPRLVGDIGNRATWPFPVEYQIVRGASPELIVRQGGGEMLTPFVDAGRILVTNGAQMITTSCGFLSLFRNELADALGVPVAASALEEVASVQASLPTGRKVGILTIAANSLTAAHLDAAGVPPETPVAGVAEGCSLQRTILGNKTHLDTKAAERDMVEAACAFQAAHPELGAILFECTNMPPYAGPVTTATGLPVHSIETYLKRVFAALPGHCA